MEIRTYTQDFGWCREWYIIPVIALITYESSVTLVIAFLKWSVSFIFDKQEGE